MRFEYNYEYRYHLNKDDEEIVMRLGSNDGKHWKVQWQCFAGYPWHNLANEIVGFETARKFALEYAFSQVTGDE